MGFLKGIDPVEQPPRVSAAIQNGEFRWTENGAVIATLEGDHIANPDDWIIQGVNGELYPCKPDIFDKTYEVA